MFIAIGFLNFGSDALINIASTRKISFSFFCSISKTTENKIEIISFPLCRFCLRGILDTFVFLWPLLGFNNSNRGYQLQSYMYKYYKQYILISGCLNHLTNFLWLLPNSLHTNFGHWMYSQWNGAAIVKESW